MEEIVSIQKNSPAYKQGYQDGLDQMKKMVLTYLDECQRLDKSLSVAIGLIKENL